MTTNGRTSIATRRTEAPFSPRFYVNAPHKFHAVKWGLTALGIFAGMCGAGYLVAAIVVDKLVNGGAVNSQRLRLLLLGAHNPSIAQRPPSHPGGGRLRVYGSSVNWSTTRPALSGDHAA